MVQCTLSINRLTNVEKDMIEESLYYILTITISVAAIIIYVIAYKKLGWDFLWVGITGASLSGLSGLEIFYRSINYENMGLKDHLMVNMWAVGWALEVVCLYMILSKVMKIQSQLNNKN